MKKLFLFLLIVSVPVVFMAQSGAIKKGGMEVNAGLGFWSNSPVIIPLHGGMDFGITDDISVGFDVGWRLYNSVGWNHSVFVLQGRADYHFNSMIGLDNQWDIYAGLQLGPALITASGDYPEEGHLRGFNFALDAVVGGRWFFSDNVGLNAEVGLMGVIPDIIEPPNVFLNLGLTFRLK
ncbi:MAG: hypothetical protein GXO86_13450 [Chlorobi bacterium]|nr:hypothetical protein [Chlorobiota bacterium]